MTLLKRLLISISTLQNSSVSNVWEHFIHWISGCDTTSKVGTKTSALKMASTKNFIDLLAFGQSDIDQRVLEDAENFLLRCISKDVNFKTFDSLRNFVYYKKATEINLEKLPQHLLVYIYISNGLSSKLLSGYMLHF